MLNGFLKRINGLHHRLESADQALRKVDAELRSVRHPLQGVGRVVEAAVHETDMKLRSVGTPSCVACARPTTPASPEKKSDPHAQLHQVATRLASREETTQELKRRLAKEIYRFESDLEARLKIASHSCDCGLKHSLGVEALVEEIEPREPSNPVYQDLLAWLRTNQPKLTPDASVSGKYDLEYPRLAGELGTFRKRVLGTEQIGG